MQKNKYRNVLLILAAVSHLTQAGLGQNIHLAGITQDSLTGERVPYTTIELEGKGVGTLCDSAGVFELTLDESLLNGIVTVRNLGYEPKFIPVSALIHGDTIKLVPQIYAIREVTVTSFQGKNIREKGVADNGPNSATYGMSKWTQIAFFMDNKEGFSGRIKSAGFYIPKVQKYRTPFRLRVYSCDADGQPSDDLLQDEVILQARKGGEWITVDLTPFNLAIPPNGYFVAMEWINAGKQYTYHEVIKGEKLKFYGQKLGLLLHQESPLTWIKFVGEKWRNDGRMVGGGKYGYRNAMIKSEILIE